MALPLLQSLAQARGADASPQHSPQARHKQSRLEVSGVVPEAEGDCPGLPPPSSHGAPSLPRASGWWLSVPGGNVSSSCQTFTAGSTCAQPHSCSSRTWHTPALLGLTALSSLYSHHQFFTKEREWALERVSSSPGR